MNYLLCLGIVILCGVNISICRPTVGIRIEVLNTDNSSLLVTLSPDIVVGKESVVNVSVTKGHQLFYSYTNATLQQGTHFNIENPY